MARSAVLSFPMVKIGTAAVTVSLDNVANDGQAGENDMHGTPKGSSEARETTC